MKTKSTLPSHPWLFMCDRFPVHRLERPGKYTETTTTPAQQTWDLKIPNFALVPQMFSRNVEHLREILKEEKKRCIHVKGYCVSADFWGWEGCGPPAGIKTEEQQHKQLGYCKMFGRFLHPQLSDILNCCYSNENWSWKSELCLSYNLYINVSNLIVLFQNNEQMLIGYILLSATPQKVRKTFLRPKKKSFFSFLLFDYFSIVSAFIYSCTRKKKKPYIIKHDKDAVWQYGHR